MFYKGALCNEPCNDCTCQILRVQHEALGSPKFQLTPESNAALYTNSLIIQNLCHLAAVYFLVKVKR
jgi:hypothetical protein